MPMSASTFWPRWYRILARANPVIERVWRRVGLGNTVRVVLPGRRTGLPRSVFLGILRVGDGVYLGHPDAVAAWTLNLDAAGGGEIELHDGRRLRFAAELLGPGPEREAVIRATFRQHPFPGGLLYWFFRGNVRSAGRFYRLSPARRG
jgi:hypothetical protein